MKILHIITKSELGGAQSVLTNIVNELCKQQHDITVIAGEGDGKMYDALDKRVHVIHCPHLRRNISLYHDLLALLFLIKVNFTLKPEIIHLHSSKAGLLGRIAFPRKKTVYTVHGFDSIRIAYRKLLPIEHIMQKWTGAIVGVSKYDVDNLYREGINKNVSLIYNGIPERIYSEKPALRIPSKYTKIVLSIARVSKPKRHDIFIECAKLLPEYAFVWIGNLEEMKNLPENVFFLGNVSNASKYCQCADLFMLSSDYEGLPIVILEAMSYGLPIVASAVGGIPEIVKNDKNGYVISNDVIAFVAKIDRILKNQQLKQEFSTFSLQTFRENFTCTKMVESYIEIYKKLSDQ